MMLWNRGPAVAANMGQRNSKLGEARQEQSDSVAPHPPETTSGRVENGQSRGQLPVVSPGFAAKDDHLQKTSSVKDVRNPRSPLNHFDQGLRNSESEDSRLDRRTEVDYFSPRGPRNAASPPNLRQSFVPDGGSRDLEYERRYNTSPRSPDSRPNRTRADRYIPSHRRSPSPKRSSPSKRRYFSRNDRNRRQSNSSPPPLAYDGTQGEADRRKSSHYQNLTWKAADQPIKEIPAIAAHVTRISDGAVSPNLSRRAPERQLNDGNPSKVDFNGVKGVPTGPKQDVSIKWPKLDSSIKRSPHLFISAESLPPKPATVKHLHGFLRKFVAEESDVSFDELGYYIRFPDTDYGRYQLGHCYDTHHQAPLFGMYVLHMEQFPYGQAVVDPHLYTNRDETAGDNGDDHVAQFRLAAEENSNSEALLNNQRLPIEARAQTSRKQSLEVQSGAPTSDPIMTTVKEATLAGDLYHQALRHSSPLYVPSRLDKEDSSSCVSVVTGSDKSASKLSKCHVCKRPSTPDTAPLTRCSSCPRKYHRHCQPPPGVPSNLGPDHSWQCRRCVKKQIPPKSRLSVAANSISPPPSVGQPEEPPLKRPRLNPTTTDPEAVLTGCLDNEDGQVEEGAQVVFSLDQNAITEVQFDRSQQPHQTMEFSDEVHREAEDLVEQSFLPKSTLNVVGSAAKAGKPKFTRIKTSRAKESALGLPRDYQNEGPKEGAPTIDHEPPASEEDQAIEAPKEKKKPHKWSGGGADKDIIRAGQESIFRAHQQTAGRKSAPSVGGGIPQYAQDELVLGADDVEVPETPDKVTPVIHTGTERDSVDRDIQMSPPNEVQSKSIQDTNGIQLSSNATQRLGPTQKGTTGRRTIKPGSSGFEHCSSCGKKIAYNPSGTNTLCTRCKRETSTKAADGIPKKTLESSEPKIQISQNTSSGTGVLNQYVSARRGYGADVMKETGVHKANELLEINEHAVLPQTEPSSCETCREAGKRCEHNWRSDGRSFGFTGRTNMEDKDDSNDEMDVEDSGDDLGLKSARPKPAENHPSNGSPSRETDHGAIKHGHSLKMRPTDGASRSSSESPNLNGASITTATANRTTKITKRISHTRPARDENDLGDSWQRPKNTYAKLIGMALYAAPGYRLKANDIIQWVVENVDGYHLGEGNNWENGIRATITMRREGYRDTCKPLWKALNQDTEEKEYWYELLPKRVEFIPRWDAVRQRIMYPKKDSHDQQTSDEEDDGAENDDGDVALVEEPTSQWRVSTKSASNSLNSSKPSKSTMRRRPAPKQDLSPFQPDQVDDASGASPEGDSPEQTDEADNPVVYDVSSDEEPLATQVRKSSKASALPGDQQAEDRDAMDIDPPVIGQADGMATSRMRMSNRLKIDNSPRAIDEAQKTRLGQLIRSDAQDKGKLVQDLFKEWPEYNPKNQIDTAEKIAQIKARPTRKQRFGKLQSPDPWIIPESTVEPGNKSSKDTSKSRNKHYKPFRRPGSGHGQPPPEIEDEEEITCNSLEELFQMPPNPFPIYNQGQIAFRDGVRNEDGVLPRAKVIYKIGYA